MNAYLSIDLDYWCEHNSPDNAIRFFKKVIGLHVPITFVIDGCQETKNGGLTENNSVPIKEKQRRYSRKQLKYMQCLLKKRKI